MKLCMTNIRKVTQNNFRQFVTNSSLNISDHLNMEKKSFCFGVEFDCLCYNDDTFVWISIVYVIVKYMCI